MSGQMSECMSEDYQNTCQKICQNGCLKFEYVYIII